jgi:hypothetical protein
MRNKKIFSFDEERDAEEVIRDGFPNEAIDYSKMYLVAKYFRQKFNYGEIRLERELIKFCKVQDENFNPIVDSESIKKWIKAAMDYNLRKIESVTISQKEIDFLKSIEVPKDRKILFMTLILSKALKKTEHSKQAVSDKYYIRYNNFLDIIRLAKISNLSEVGLADIYNKYKEHFGLYSPERELLKLKYADPTGEGVDIDDMDKIMDYYELFFEKKKEMFFCSVCGKEIVKKNNKQKYCADCSKGMRKERQKKIMRERRSS